MTSKRVKPPKEETRAPANGTWQFIDANTMRDYRQNHKAMQSKAKSLLEPDPPTQSSSDSSPIPTTTDSDGASSSSDRPAAILFPESGGQVDQIFHWPSEWESTLREVESLTISPPHASGTKAALGSRPQKGGLTHGTQPSSKPFLVASSLSLNASPGNGAGDPFNALPNSAPDASELIHYFNFIFRLKTAPGPNGEPSPMTTLWMPLTIADPLLFQTSINFAAAHRDCLRPQQSQRKSLVRKIQAIDMANARLNCPKAAISDESIGAICLLAATERMFGNLDELRVHIAVLPRMVELRGGPDALRKSREILYMFVIWEDMLSAVALSAPPLFSHPPCCSMIRVPLLYPNMAKPQLSADPNPLNADLFSIFSAITNLTTRILQPICRQDVENISSQLLGLMDATNPYLFSDPCSYGTFTADELHSFSKQRHHIDRRLRSLRPLHATPARARTPLAFTQEAARLGCLIYTHTVLSRNLPQPLSVLLTLTKEAIALVTTAEHAGVLNLRQRSPPGPFIWLLCLGGVLPLTEEQQAWFAARIVDVMAHSEMFREFARGGPAARGMCWNIGLETSPVRGLWRRVEGIWERERIGRLGKVEC